MRPKQIIRSRTRKKDSSSLMPAKMIPVEKNRARKIREGRAGFRGGFSVLSRKIDEYRSKDTN